MTTEQYELTEEESKLLAIVNKERKARRDAEKEMKHFRAKFREQREQAQFWESQAVRHSNACKTLRLRVAQLEGKA